MSAEDVNEIIRTAHKAEPEELLPPVYSEERLATLFTERYRTDLRFCAEWGSWLRWSGEYWRRDRTYEVFDLARGLCREVAAAIGSEFLGPQRCRPAR